VSTVKVETQNGHSRNSGKLEVVSNLAEPILGAVTEYLPGSFTVNVDSYEDCECNCLMCGHSCLVVGPYERTCLVKPRCNGHPNEVKRKEEWSAENSDNIMKIMY